MQSVELGRGDLSSLRGRQNPLNFGRLDSVPQVLNGREAALRGARRSPHRKPVSMFGKVVAHTILIALTLQTLARIAVQRKN